MVWKGRRTGIFTSWPECEAQVKGFTGAQYKGFTNRAAAEQALRDGFAGAAGQPAARAEWLFAAHPPAAESLAVDAACSGSPGRLEYRGVHTSTGKVIFHQGPYENGTNNVGEFLAIVQALAWLEKAGRRMPVYSDSGTAMAWVKAGRCKTGLVRDGRNAVLFDLIAQAEAWLAGHPSHGPVLKWDTHAWGEIPADYGRK